MTHMLRTLGIGLVLLAVAMGASCQPVESAPLLEKTVFSVTQPPAIEQFDISLPSDGAGGGTLAVRLFASGRTFLSEGAPVIIEIPGGDGTGTLLPFPTSALSGFVYVTFLFPGGSSQGRTSAGVYDHRGLNSIKALRDVILFASGAKPDAQGRFISQIVKVPVLTQNVGLLAISNGGNVAFVTAALYGEQLPNLKYIVAWEVPSNGQMAATDAGPGANFDCPARGRGRRPRFANPYYRAYGPIVLDIDYSRIAYDASADKLFLDGNGNGRWDAITDFQGCRVPDLNRNGQIDAGEDFGLNAIYGASPREKGHYSLQTVRAVREAKLFARWPSWLDTPEESEHFWQLRDAARNFDLLAQKRPDLQVMILASVEDHVQTVLGKPHIRQLFEAAQRGGLWVKLNPSRGSVLAVDRSLGTRSDLPDNAATTPPADWNNYAYAYPEDVRDAVYQAAGVREMAERARSSAEAHSWAQASPAQVTVAPSVRYQTIDGFGAGLTATAFRSRASLYTELSPERRQALADLLWRELGATLVRLQIYDELEAENDDGDPNHFDWSRFNLNAGPPGELEAIQDALARSVTTTIAVTFSPPVWMKDNRNLRLGHIVQPQEFAEFLAAYVLGMQQQHNVHIDNLALLNEPTVPLAHSTATTPEELRDLLRVVGKRFRELGLTTRLAAPDTGNVNAALEYAKIILADSEARSYVALLSTHDYRSQQGTAGQGSVPWRELPMAPWADFAALAAQYNLPLWQTEMVGNVSPQGVPGDPIEIALFTATLIHQALTQGNASAWMQWEYFWEDDVGGLAQIRGGDFRLNKNYWALWHFSHFISPGAVRIGAEASDPALLVSAYAVGDQQTIIVAINPTGETKSARFALPGLSGSVTHYVTTASEDGARRPNLPAAAGSLDVTLEARSIHTLIVHVP